MSDDPKPDLLGLHHVTAICGDPQPNIDFWVGLLGQRLVKRTVNFDDPGTWHLYYGDAIGTPGTIMTFFPWTSAPPLTYARGRAGAEQIVSTMFAVPPSSFDFWVERLAGSRFEFDVPPERFGERRLAVRDPDGIVVELVTAERRPQTTWWSDGPIPAEHAIAGIHGVAILVNEAAPTDALLAQLGFRSVGRDDAAARYAIGDSPGSVLDVLEDADAEAGRMGIGAVHHVAWRTAEDEDQPRWQRVVADAGALVTEVRDRQYFRSIYFREPGGVLFEIATDGPGFTYDEPAESLGSELRLPPWFEERRAAIEAKLPAIHPPRAWRL